MNPIDLDIKVGLEQEITFNAVNAIRIGVPSEIEMKLDVEVYGNHLWLTALQAFENTKIIIITEPFGRLIVRLNAGSQLVSNQPIVIREPSKHSNQESSYIPKQYSYVMLTRWVVQQLYAPPRLLNPLKGVNRIPIAIDEIELFRCHDSSHNLCAGGVVGVPLASWRSNRLYISAIELNNQLNETVVLDPRILRGRWRAATFVHNSLQPKGLNGDNTVLILISEFPFEYSIAKSN